MHMTLACGSSCAPPPNRSAPAFRPMAPKGRVRKETLKASVGPRRWQRSHTIEQRQAGAELLRCLLEWYSTCKLTAQQFCTACEFCHAAGVQGGAFKQYGLPPGKPSGSYQKHLDSVFPNPEVTYEVSTPVNLNHFSVRTNKMTPVKYAWKRVEDELALDPSILDTLGAAPGDRKKARAGRARLLRTPPGGR
eukprot:9472591-Pyramimonas_sp.AAC.1